MTPDFRLRTSVTPMFSNCNLEVVVKKGYLRLKIISKEISSRYLGS